MQQEINIKVVAQDRAKNNDFKQLFLEMYAERAFSMQTGLH